MTTTKPKPEPNPPTHAQQDHPAEPLQHDSARHDSALQKGAQQENPRQESLQPVADDRWTLHAHWEALVDAGLIGNRLPTPPDVIAQREANDALFRRRAPRRMRWW